MPNIQFGCRTGEEKGAHSNFSTVWPAEAASIKRDAYQFFFPPNDVASPLELVARHRERKAVRDVKRSYNLQCRAGVGQILRGTFDPDAVELDHSRLTHATTRGCPNSSMTGPKARSTVRWSEWQKSPTRPPAFISERGRRWVTAAPLPPRSKLHHLKGFLQSIRARFAKIGYRI